MLNNFILYTLYSFIFLYPLFFLTVTSESYEYNKLFLSVAVSLILLFLFILKSAANRIFVVTRTTFGFLLTCLALLSLLSLLFQSPNIVIALTTPLSTAAMLAGLVIYFVTVNSLTKPQKTFATYLLVIDAVLLAAYVIFLYTGLLPKSNFTPAGTLLSTLIYLIIMATFLTSRIVSLFIRQDTKHTETARSAKDLEVDTETANPVIFHGFALIPVIAALALLIFHHLTDQNPAILPYNFAWATLMEVMKNIKSLALGIGPSNYLTAFTLSKQTTFNASPYWNMYFTSASSYVLTLATEIGIGAGIVFILILLKAVRGFIRLHRQREFGDARYSLFITLITALVMQLLLPSTGVIFLTTIFLLAFTGDKKTFLYVDLGALGKLSYLLLLPVIIFILFISYFGGKFYVADYYFKKSLDALVNGDAGTAYTWQGKAIGLNPYIDRYHIAYSQTSLAIANATASKKDLTDADRQNIPKLVQQSIDHARSAVSLFRTNISGWDNLAKIYASLVNFASGSDNWAIESYQQKLILDPVSPMNHLSLGGMYLTMEKYPEAEFQFRQAISLKPDFANAHYNLAYTLRQEKKYDEAYQEMKTTVSLINPLSDDAKKLNTEIDQIKNLLPDRNRETGNEASQAAKPKNIPVDQTLETVPASDSSLLQNVPTTIPTIALPSPTVTPYL